jgi:hypothetical protein
MVTPIVSRIATYTTIFSLSLHRANLGDPMHSLPSSLRLFLAAFVWFMPLWGTSGQLCAQELPTIRAEIAPTSGSLRDLYLLTVTIDGAQEKVAPQLQAGGDFDVQLIAPRTSVTIINGEIRTQQSYVYQLTPKREGSLLTPEVQASVGQQMISASPLSVMVTGGASAAPPLPANDDLFLHQSAHPHDVYQGQQIVNTIGVYASINVQGVSIDDEVSDGFWQEVISDNNSSRKTIKGKEFHSLAITRALFPLRSGELVIGRRKANAKVATPRLGSGSRFDPFSDDFFNNFFQPMQVKDVPLQSNEVRINVKPLPPVPAELSMRPSGLVIVGPTSIAVDYTGNVIKAGESKTISITVSSEGNLNPLKSLPLSAPQGVKLYDGQAQIKHKTRGGRLVTEKIFTYTAIPLHGGTFRIPAVSVVFFDPSSASYRVTTTSDIAFVVEGDPAPTQPDPKVTTPSTGGTGARPQLLPTLPPVPFAPPLSYSEKSKWESILDRVSVQLALLIVAATIAIVAVTILVVSGRRFQRPHKRLSEQLNSVLTLADVESFLREWIDQQFPGAHTTSSWDELRAIIRNKSGNTPRSLAIMALIDDIELQRYGGAHQTSIEELKGRLSQIIKT